MDAEDVASWFADYLDCFVALGRGARDDVEAVLAYYGVPMLLSTDAATTWLADTDQVLGVASDQVATLYRAGFDRTDVEDAHTVVLNATCARHEGRFVRRRADGDVLARFTATYLITDGPAGRRIAALAVHGAA